MVMLLINFAGDVGLMISTYLMSLERELYRLMQILADTNLSMSSVREMSVGRLWVCQIVFLINFAGNIVSMLSDYCYF